jgi:hypothetical protein
MFLSVAVSGVLNTMIVLNCDVFFQPKARAGPNSSEQSRSEYFSASRKIVILSLI